MQSEHFNFPMPTAEDEADIGVVSEAINQIDKEMYKMSEIGKYGGNIVYTINIDKRGSGNNILWVNIDGVTSYDDLDGKIIAVYTGIYCCQWDTPQQVYINVNGLGSRAIRRPLPTYGSADYDIGKTYYTDKYVKGEISRYQTLLLSFLGSSVTLLNPAPPTRATTEISDETTDGASYVTPKLLSDYVASLQNDIVSLRLNINRLSNLIDFMRIECTNYSCTASSASATVKLYYGMLSKIVTLADNKGTNYHYLVLCEALDVDLKESCNDYRLYTQEEYDKAIDGNPSLSFYEVERIDGVGTYFSKNSELVE